MCRLPLVLDDENLTALVVAATRAHGVRKLDLAALRAHRARGHSANVIGAATGVGTSTTGFLLRHCHGCHFSLSISADLQPKRFKCLNSDESR